MFWEQTKMTYIRINTIKKLIAAPGSSVLKWIKILNIFTVYFA